MDVFSGESKAWWCKQQYCIETWKVRSMNQGKLDMGKQEMARVNINILGISELQCKGMGEFNSYDHCIYYCGQESLRRNGVALIVNKCYFANKCAYSQSYGFSSSQVWMWELDMKEGWASKNSWFWTVVLEKTLERPLDSMEIKPISPIGNQPWICIEMTDG